MLTKSEKAICGLVAAGMKYFDDWITVDSKILRERIICDLGKMDDEALSMRGLEGRVYKDMVSEVEALLKDGRSPLN